MEYDYLVVGAGLWGSVFAREATDAGKRCLVIDKRNHIGGNCYTEVVDGIPVHVYGPHIFHTSIRDVWRYVNRFDEFMPFINAPMASYRGSLYNLPINMNTLNSLWGVVRPRDAEEHLRRSASGAEISEPKNLEEKAKGLVGPELYEMFIKGYTQKQWGRPCKDLPASIITRLPVRFTYDNNYYNDVYQGIPSRGYGKFLSSLLDGIDVELGVDFFKDSGKYHVNKVVYTGAIDELFGYCYGELEFRSLEFKTDRFQDVSNFQGNAVVNYTDYEVPYTRIVEHKFFDRDASKLPNTVITYEYPAKYERGRERYYPVNNEENTALYEKYKKLADGCKGTVLVGGRLGEYKYYDMDKTIVSSLMAVKRELN